MNEAPGPSVSHAIEQGSEAYLSEAKVLNECQNMLKE